MILIYKQKVQKIDGLNTDKKNIDRLTGKQRVKYVHL